MVRLLLAAVVTSGLLAASTPALSNAGHQRADVAIERQVRELSTRLERFAVRNDPTESGSAQVVVTLNVPARSLTSAGVEQVTFERRGERGVVTWQVGADQRASQELVERPLRPDGGTLTLESTGAHRLVFGLKLDAGQPVVTVRRLTGPSEGETSDV